MIAAKVISFDLDETLLRPTATGIDVYHKAHRYRAKGALWSGTAPMFQRRSPGQAAR